MPIAVEIVHLPSSEAFRKDHAIFDPVLEFVASANGNLGAYYGFLKEDPNEAYMIVVWETVEHHYALMNDPEVYPRMLEAVKECVVGPVKLYHALLEPTSAVAVALNSPVASIDHIVELKAGVTREGMLAELSNLFRAPPSDTPSTAFRGGCFGKVVENSELTVIRGWDSSLDLQAVDRGKVHIEEEYANLRAESVASGRTVHATLSAYKTYQG